jgi:hypothetical protein
MPNLGAGVDQHVNTTAAPTWVYNAPAYVAGSNYTPTLRLYNEGTNVLFVGGVNVTPSNGLALPPGSKPLEIQNVYGTVYTCGNSVVGGNTAAATLGTGVPATAGSTTLKLNAMNANFTPGSTLIVGSGTNLDYVIIASTATTVVTLSNSTLYYHPAAELMTLATTTIGQLRVTAGT